MGGTALGLGSAEVHLSLVASQGDRSPGLSTTPGNFLANSGLFTSLEQVLQVHKGILFTHVSNVSQEPADIQAPGGRKFPLPFYGWHWGQEQRGRCTDTKLNKKNRR